VYLKTCLVCHVKVVGLKQHKEEPQSYRTGVFLLWVGFRPYLGCVPVTSWLISMLASASYRSSRVYTMYMRKNRKVHLMDIFTIQMVRQDLNRANAEMYNAKENILGFLVMTFLGAALVAITSYLYFGYAAMYTSSTDTMVFLLTGAVVGIGALVCATIMIVNAVKDFRRASRRMRVASSNMYQLEERLLRKAA